VTTPEEAEKLIIKGWQFVAVLPNDKVVLRQGSTQKVGGPDRIRTILVTNLVPQHKIQS